MNQKPNLEMYKEQIAQILYSYPPLKNQLSSEGEEREEALTIISGLTKKIAEKPKLIKKILNDQFGKQAKKILDKFESNLIFKPFFESNIQPRNSLIARNNFKDYHSEILKRNEAFYHFAREIIKLFEETDLNPDIWFRNTQDFQKCFKRLYKQMDDFKNILQNQYGDDAELIIDELAPLVLSKQSQKKTFLNQLMREPIEIFEKGQLINYKLQYREASFEIFKQISRKQKEYIENIFTNSCSNSEILMKILQYLKNCISRKVQLLQLVESIKKIIQAIFEKIPDKKVYQIFRDITLRDLVCLLVRHMKNKREIGRLLNNLGQPLPVLFYYNDSEQGNMKIGQYNPDIYDDVVNSKNYSLVVNIGTKGMINKGKTKFLETIYFLTPQEFNKEMSYDVGVRIYTNVIRRHQNKKLNIVDFSGDCLNQDSNYQQTLQRCLKNAGIIYLHILASEFENIYIKKDIRRYLDLGKQRNNFFLVIRGDSKTQKQAIQIGSRTYWSIKIQDLREKKYGEFDKLINEIFQEIDKATILNPLKILSIQGFRRKIQTKQFIEVRQSIVNIIESIQDHERFKIVFPRYSKNERLIFNSNKLAISHKKMQSEVELLKQQQNKEQKEQIEQKQVQKSPILQILISYQPSFQQLMELAVYLQNRKSQHTFLLQSAYEYIKDKYTDRGQDMEQELRKLQENDNLINIDLELVMNELILQKQSSQNAKVQDEIISRYYHGLKDNNIPINLIDGKLLKFGNKNLQSFFKQLHGLTKGKKIYVVSIIGGQSSAKSTLLNYLFECNFPTSSGRCTRGANFVLAQLRDKYLLVMDTEGLLSTSQDRDKYFDIKMACFLLLISDLMIVNIKGQINKNLQDMMKICAHVVESINSSQERYKASQLMFVLRDISDSQFKGSKMLQKLQNNLKLSSRIINFNQKDIYTMQSAFMNQNIEKFSYQVLNNQFGKKILLLRQVIYDKLKQPRFSNFEDFYFGSQSYWQTLMQHDNDELYNFRTNHDINLKNKLFEEFKNFKEQKSKGCIRNITFTIQEMLQKDKSQIITQLTQKIKKQQSKSKQEFESICKKYTRSKQWINLFQRKIEEMMLQLHLSYKKQIVEKLVILKDNRMFQNLVKTKLKEQFQREDRRQYEIIESQLYQIFVNQQSEIQRGMGDQRNLLLINLNAYVQSMNQKNKTNTFSLEVLNANYYYYTAKKEGVQKKEQEAKIKQMFLLGKHNQPLDLIRSIDNPQIMYHIKRYFVVGRSILQKIFSSQEFVNNNSFDDIFKKSEELLQKLYQGTENLIQNYEQQIYFRQSSIQGQVPLSLKLSNKMNFICLLFSQIPQIWEKLYKSKKKISGIRKNEMNKAILNRAKTELRLYDIQPHKLCEELARHFLRSNTQKLLNQSKKSLRFKIQRQGIYDSQMLFWEVLMESIFKKSKGKPNIWDYSQTRWINCYKFIKDIKSYMIEYYRKQYYDKIFKRMIKNQFVILCELLKASFHHYCQSLIVLKRSDRRPDLNYYCNSLDLNLLIQLPQNAIDFFDHIHVIQNLETRERFLNTQIQCLEAKMNQFEQTQMEEFLKQAVYPQIIGCDEKCPICGVKCKNKKNHLSYHEAVPYSHLFLCSNRWSQNSLRAKQESLFEISGDCRNQNLYRAPDSKIVNWVKENHPNWYYNFARGPSPPNRMIVQLQFIWANIENIISKERQGSLKSECAERLARRKRSTGLKSSIIKSRFLDVIKLIDGK